MTLQVARFRIRRAAITVALAGFTAWAFAVPSASAAQPWVDTRSVGPFVCQATFPLADCDPILYELPELQRELTRTLGIPPTRKPVNIYLFTDSSQHQTYIEQHFPHVPYRRALFVQEGDQAGVYAFRHAELDIDLRHECTHALLHGVLPVVPLWLDEGLAEYFEVPAARRAFDHPHYEALRWNMRLGMVESVATLEKRTVLAEMGALDYRYAWAWVHFMLHGPQTAHRTLVTYLAEIQHGGAPGQFSERLAEAVPDPTVKMVQHFKHWRQ